MPRSNTLAVLENVLIILRRIQGSPTITRKRLAEELGRSEKTIKRYLEALDRAGFYLDTDEDGHFKRYIRLHPETRQGDPLQLITLSRSELIQLYLHLAGLHHAGDRSVNGALWQKIRNALGAETVDAGRLSAMLTGFDKAYKSYETPEARAAISALLEALYANRTCRVTYQTPYSGRPRTYRIEPYQLFEFDGGLYCHCRVPYYGHVRMLAVERIKALTINEEEFRRQPEVLALIEERSNRAFRIIDDEEPLAVTLRFSRHVAFYVAERTWHPSQRLTRHQDGTLTMRFTASGKTEITRWIWSWGPDCEVVAPKGLREAVMMTAQ